MSQTHNSNPELDLAYNFINYTNRNIFLTGKAGTGKTTFLHRIRRETIKRCVVVAPTGIAAINAKGMTIHSMFQLPFGIFLPNTQRDIAQRRRFNQRKIDLIRTLDLLIIDEISMVRCDMLDAIDDVLRRYRDRTKPFGGVQLLMIGDLHQLPPVVKDADWNMLREHYQTPYFFGSLALQATDPITIQLTHIYRQSDEYFINLLNRVRNNRMDNEILTALNSRYLPDFQPPANLPYITLTSHNKTASVINQEKLDLLDAKSHFFKAKVSGQFPENTYPTEEEMELKVGAQVLFIKNDPSGEREYYNGKIGEIIGFEQDVIRIKCPEDEEPIKLTPVEWQNVKYDLDTDTKTVEENIIGTFEQYPLKLAWAITIHKSQGLTFERVIIDAAAAFAHGQVYVALSRCKSFEGIVLRTKINQSSVRTDTVVRNYNDEAIRNAPGETELEQSKRAYQAKLIKELFSFERVQKNAAAVRRVFMENERALSTKAMNMIQEWNDLAGQKVFGFATKFQPQLEQYLKTDVLPENNVNLQERIQKASAYFFQQVKELLLPELQKVPLLTDNKQVRKQASDRLKTLEKALFVKGKCFKETQQGFVAYDYLKNQSNANLDYNQYKANQAAKKTVKFIRQDLPHPFLYAKIQHWRNQTASLLGVEPFEVLQLKSMQQLVECLPLDSKNLLKINGIGKYKATKYGVEILDMIQAYVKDKDLGGNLFTEPIKKERKARKPRINSKKVSFDLFKSGKSIEEIAEERGFVVGTIEGHLAHFIGEGELDIIELMDTSKVKEIADYMTAHPDFSSADIKQHFGEKYSYNELRMVRNSMTVNNTSKG